MIKQELLDILACPKCCGDLILKGDNLICENDKLSYPITDGIPMLLIEEANTID